MHWNNVPIHIIDFEGSKTSGVLEYGIVTLYNDTIAETHTRLCAPQGSIHPRETQQHGLTEKNTQGALPFSASWTLFSQLRTTGPLAAHNATTENTLIKATWPYPKSSPDFLDLNKKSTSWGPWVDTYILFKTLYPQLENHKLMNLIDLFQLSDKLTALAKQHCPENRRKPHCALYDALASSLLLSYLGNLPEFKEMTLQWLILNSSPINKRDSIQQLSL